MESQEPKISVLKAGKIKPHQFALWFAIGFIALLLLTPYFFGTFLFGRQFASYLSYLMWPGIWFSWHMRLSEGWNFMAMIIWGLFVVYFIFYIPIKLWMTSSRHLHIALVVYVVLCFATYEFYQWYSNKPDWSSHGLNPNRPGFMPQVVVLAGKFDFYAHDSSVNLNKSGTAFFEIRMRGHDYYYCRRWHGNTWHPGSWFNVEIANHGEGFHFGLHCSSFETGGGGGSWYGDNLAAQRLWNKQEFVGAKKDDLVFKEANWPKRKEEFSHLVKVGRWLIPTHIRLTQSGNDAQEENYYIKKIEFLPTPDTNWFEQVFQKYSDFKSASHAKDFGEPGIAPGKRK